MKLLVAAAVVAAALPARAYVREPSQWAPSSMPIHFEVNPAGAGQPRASALVAQAFGTWTAASCASLTLAQDPDTAQSSIGGDGVNRIVWRATGWEADTGTGSGVIGLTTPEWTVDQNGVAGSFVDADIRFNATDYTWSTDGAGDTVDLLSIATHEEGHFLGLGHTPDQGAIMYASYSGGTKRDLAPDDLAGICAIYPGSGGGGVSGGTPGTAHFGQPCDRAACDAGLTCATWSSGAAPTCAAVGALGAVCGPGANVACPSHLACRDDHGGSFCEQPCAASRDCTARYLCVAGYCTPKPNGPAPDAGTATADTGGGDSVPASTGCASAGGAAWAIAALAALRRRRR